MLSAAASAASGSSTATAAPEEALLLSSLVQSFHPTPLEHAYSNYILATHFSIPPPDYSNDNHHGNNNNGGNDYYECDNIRLSGRNAAPFLSTAVLLLGSSSSSCKGGVGTEEDGDNSNNNCINIATTTIIDRQFLKLAWHMVDPEEIGTLTSRKQFYVLLRLIAMAQAGFFPREEVVTEGKVASMLRIFQQGSHLAVPPPTFAAENESVRPSVARLLEAYPPPPSSYSQSSLLFNNNVGGNVDIIIINNNNNMTITPPPSSSSTSMTIMSVHDAFDALVSDEAKDLPLPSLSLVKVAAGEVEEEDDDLVVENHHHINNNDNNNNNLEQEEKNGYNNNDDDADALIMEGRDEEEKEEDVVFGSFEDINNAFPLVSTSSSSPHHRHQTMDIYDGHNKFSACNVNDIQDAHHGQMNIGVDDDGDGKFEGEGQCYEDAEDYYSINHVIRKDDLHDIDKEGLDEVDSVVRDNAVGDEDHHFNYDCDEDDFGDFEEFPPLPSVEVGDIDFEVGSGAVQGDDGDSNAIVANRNMVSLADEDTEVGISCPNFDHVLRIQEEMPPSKGHNNIVVWEDGTATTTYNSVNTQINLSSAFDGLLDVEDAPLPPLESFYSAPIGAESGNMDVDEFCEFETASAGAATEKVELTSVKEGNYFNDDVKGPQPCNDQGTNDEDIELHGTKLDGKKAGRIIVVNGEYDLSSVFDAFGKTRDAPLPCLDSILPSADERDSENVAGTGILGEEIKVDDDVFDDFDGGKVKCSIGDYFSSIKVNGECNATRNGVSSGFGDFCEVQDAPMPSLNPIPPSEERHFDNFVGILGDEIEEDNDDFGDFEGVIKKCSVDDNYEDANVITEDSLFHPLAESIDALPLTTSFGSFDGQGENVLSRETICDASNFEIPSFTDCQVANHSHCINSSAMLDSAASGVNESEEFAETEAALHLNYADQLDSLQVVSKNYADEESLGQFDDNREAGIHNSAEELPVFDASISERLTETDISVIDSLSAIDNDIDSKARGAIFGGENEGDFSQFESHIKMEEHLENIEGRAYAEESYKENSDNLDEFDAGFGDFTSFEETNHQAISRKCDLEALICRDFEHESNRLVGCWKHIISVVEHDMQQGSKMMSHLANNISAADRAAIIKSVKLREYIRGLAEVVRIVRSITATIGELLCVDKNIEVHESTLSQWNDEVIIADAIVIEFLWSQIVSVAVELRIVSQAPQLETVIEIRNQYSSTEKADLCQLTLRSLLVGGSCTTSSVTWRDKKYMACAANFCANRMPELKI